MSKFKLKEQSDQKRLAEFREAPTDLRETLALISTLLEKHADNPVLVAQLASTQVKLAHEYRSSAVASHQLLHVDELKRVADCMAQALSIILRDSNLPNYHEIVDAVLFRWDEIIAGARNEPKRIAEAARKTA